MIPIVAGLGFGDEGKGSIVDALVRQHHAQCVVRYNGGSQAAHHVVTNDGRSHVFSQFGSGTLAGAATYLSRFMTIDPPALLREAEHLRALGIGDPFQSLWLAPHCPIVTPYHKALNRLREAARGGAKHGSCGQGIGEVARDLATGFDAIHAVDLLMPDILKHKASLIRDRLSIEAESLKSLDDEVWALMRVDPHEWALRCALPRYQFSIDVPYAPYRCVFEGAQGVLLDEHYGFHPYTTWSTTTFENALQLLLEYDIPRQHVVCHGITRCFMTRHGAGPLPSEVEPPPDLFGEHNGTNHWQGSLRIGYLDLPLLRYACRVAKPDILGVTHLDNATRLPLVCTEYKEGEVPMPISKPSGECPSATTAWLEHVTPRYVQFTGTVVQHIERATELSIGVRSYGPIAQQKTWFGFEPLVVST